MALEFEHEDDELESTTYHLVEDLSSQQFSRDNWSDDWIRFARSEVYAALKRAYNKGFRDGVNCNR